MWREFLAAAASEDAAQLGRARLRGQRLLAAEARAAAGSCVSLRVPATGYSQARGAGRLLVELG
jgi:hypothetical protein